MTRFVVGLASMMLPDASPLAIVGRRFSRAQRAWPLLAVVSSAIGCSALTSDVCFDILGHSTSPVAPVIRVGESFTAHLELTGCGGQKVLADTVWWTTNSTGVVTVDSATGVTRGLAPGTATITAHAKHYGVNAPISVTVTP